MLRMNKQEYLDALTAELRMLPEADRKDILSDYDSHFTEGVKKKKSEESIAEKLGDPRKIAKEILAQTAIRTAESNPKVDNVITAIIAVISLSFFNIVFVLGPVVGVAGTLFGFIMGAVSLVVAGLFSLGASILAIFSSNIELGVSPMAGILISIGALSAGFLWAIIDYYIAKYFFIFMIKYLKWNVNLIKKGL